VRCAFLARLNFAAVWLLLLLQQLLLLLLRPCCCCCCCFCCFCFCCCCLSQGQEGAVERTLRQSFLVSADMAHALHPNYTDKHDSLMAPAFQGGLVLKHNNNQRYATNAISAALFRSVWVVGVGFLSGAVCCWQLCGVLLLAVARSNKGAVQYCRTIMEGAQG
jgi:hypothetical protein